MAVDLGDYEQLTRQAVAHFWRSRGSAAKRQRQRGGSDTGARSSVTAGKNMHGFLAVVRDLVRRNGLPEFDILPGRGALTLPGYFRAAKNWDVLVIHRGLLVAALEFKSQVGSIGNNQNNRTEEALGNAVDLRTAFRERAFGDSAPPFVGYLLLLEDTPAIERPLCPLSPNFPVFPEFREASYARRYDLLCRRLVSEGLYSAAALLLTTKDSGRRGEHRELADETGLRRFVSLFAARIAAAAAMG